MCKRHCKHYTGRGLMKFMKNGNELAKEMGLSPSVLEKTFKIYNEGWKNSIFKNYCYQIYN